MAPQNNKRRLALGRKSSPKFFLQSLDLVRHEKLYEISASQISYRQCYVPVSTGRTSLAQKFCAFVTLYESAHYLYLGEI